jgi:arylsulfatase A-like enzyme
MNHGAQIYEEGVRVPLLIRWTGRVEPDQVMAEPVGLTDLAPTLLELIGVERPDGLQGESLVALLRGRSDPRPDRPIYLYRRHYDGEALADGIYVKGEQFGLRMGRWKLIVGPEEASTELFDLAADPQERVNLAEREPERVAALRRHLTLWRQTHTRDGPAAAPLSNEDRKRLEALGYAD